MKGWGLLSLEWKRVGVMDNESGDDETEELRELMEKLTSPDP